VHTPSLGINHLLGHRRDKIFDMGQLDLDKGNDGNAEENCTNTFLFGFVGKKADKPDPMLPEQIMLLLESLGLLLHHEVFQQMSIPVQLLWHSLVCFGSCSKHAI